MGLNMNPPGLLPGSNEADPGTRVLIVDDEGLTRMMIRRVLEDSGYRVLEAQDGQTATRLDAFLEMLHSKQEALV